MKEFPGHLKIQRDISLAPKTSWLIGGRDQFFAEPSSLEELTAIYKIVIENKTSITILGGGTNVLISDKGISGLVISLSKFSKIEKIEEGKDLKFWTYSGTNKSEILKIFLKYKL